MSAARGLAGAAVLAALAALGCKGDGDRPPLAPGTGSAGAGTGSASPAAWTRQPLPAQKPPLAGASIEVPPLTELTPNQIAFDEEESDLYMFDAVEVQALGFHLRIDDYAPLAADPVRFDQPDEGDAPPDRFLVKRADAGGAWFVAGRFADGGVEALGYHPAHKVKCTVLRAPRDPDRLADIARVCLSFQPGPAAR